MGVHDREDAAGWLGFAPMGIYNFQSGVGNNVWHTNSKRSRTG